MPARSVRGVAALARQAAPLAYSGKPWAARPGASGGGLAAQRRLGRRMSGCAPAACGGALLASTALAALGGDGHLGAACRSGLSAAGSFSAAAVSMSMPVDRTGLLLRLRQAMKARPYTLGFLTCAAKGVLADLITQKAIERKGELDVRRTMGMAIFSGSFCGCAYHFIFNIAFPRIFGTGVCLATLAGRISADALVVFPTLYMPCYLFFDELCRHGTLANLWQRYHAELGQSMRKYVQVWPTAMLLTFSVVPAELRVLFIASISFGWLTVLSAVSH